MEVVEVSEAPSLHAHSSSVGSVQAAEGVEAGGSDAPSRRGFDAFLKRVHNSVLFFYSSEMSTASCYLTSRVFNVVLKRRRSRAIESECHELDQSSVFRIAETDILNAIRTLVVCSTWTHAQFSFSSGWPLSQEEFVPGFQDLMFEVFSLLRSSPSLSCFVIRNPRFCYKHLPTLLYENPRLETLIVHPGAIGETNFSVLAKTIALCLSRNYALKSFEIHISSWRFNLNRESLEKLLRPFTTSLQSDANTNLKELVLRLPDFVDPGAHCENAIANLMRANTTLEKLELRFSDFRSCLKDGACKYIGRALEVNHTLKEFGCFCDLAGVKELVASFVPDLSGLQPNTTLSTLHLFFSHEVDDRRGKAFLDGLVAILNDLASMLQSNTTLKHVQVSHEWGRVWRNLDDRRQVEFGTQEKLKMMICNELKMNTSLESFAVGFWKIRRVGTEWQTSYGDPCLKEKRRPTEGEYCQLQTTQSNHAFHI